MYTRIIKETVQYALFDRQGQHNDYQIWDMTNDSNEPIFSSNNLGEACHKFNMLIKPLIYVAYRVKSNKVIAEGSLKELNAYTCLDGVGITNKDSFNHARGVKS